MKKGLKKNINKKERAITLIALVVTIVVLLILAGVSISMLGGENGIIKQAQEAKENTQIGEEKEIVNLAAQGAKENGYGAITKDRLEGELNNLTDRDTEVTGEGPFTVEYTDSGRKYNVETIGSVSESIAGKTYDTETDITIGTTQVTIPGGTTISNIAGEYENPDEGIVIYIIPENEQKTVDWEADSDNNGIIDVQEKYDQFVWVPVPNAIAIDKDGSGTVDTADIDAMIEAGQYPMAIANGTTTDAEGNTIINYRGVLYTFSEATDEVGNKYVSVSDQSYSAKSKFREPRALTRYDVSEYLSQINGILNTNYTDSTAFGNALQTDFNTMVNKVNNNKGFWVGRYETSGMSNSTTDSYSISNEIKVNIVKGTTTGINATTWYRMYAQQKLYSKLALNNTITSSMIWGSQWDQIMIWMKGVKNTSQNSFYVVNSVGIGNIGTISGVDDGYADTSVPAATGCFEVKNVYDLAGNVFEWSLEACGDFYRVHRGGYYASTGSSGIMAVYRQGTEFPYYSRSSIGSRFTFY